MRHQVKHTAIVAVLVAATQWAAPIYAAENEENSVSLEEIVVTAARREQLLQDVPVAVTALSEDFLARIGARNLEDYIGFVPSMVAAHNLFGQRAGQNIIIRGVSNSRLSGTDAGALASTTSVYLNNIPITPVELELFDMDRVEVLRGPQGTLYGSSSMGGALKLIPNRPDTDNFEAGVEGTAEVVASSGDGSGVRAFVNVPIIDGVLGARVVGSTRSRSGYISTALIPLTIPDANSDFALISHPSDVLQNNSETFRTDANASESRSLRASVLYTPNDRLSVDAGIIWQYAEVDDVGVYSSFYSQELVKENRTLEPNSSEMSLATLSISYDFDRFSIFSDTGFYEREYSGIRDFTQFLFGRFGDPSLSEIPAIGVLHDSFDIETFTQEVRIQSNHSDFNSTFLNRFEWVIGAFWMDEARHGTALLHAPGWGVAAPSFPLPSPGDIWFTDVWDGDDENKALFADVTFHFSENLTGSLGIRYFDQSSRNVRFGLQPGDVVISEQNDFGQSETGTTPRVNFSYNVSDDLMLYASYAEGFRLGGNVSPIDLDVTPECGPVIEDNNLQAFAEGEYGSDMLGTFEAGIKSTSSSGRLRINAAAYRTNWDDLQQQIRLQNIEGSTCTRRLTANVGSAIIDGVEIEVSALPSERLVLSANVSYTDARIDEPGTGITVVASGDKLRSVADWAAGLAVEYSVPLEHFDGGQLFIEGDARYVGERQAIVGQVTDERFVMDPYTLVSLRTGVSFGEKPITVTLFVNNLFNEIVELNAGRRVGVSSEVLVATSMPRTVGVTIRKDF